MKQKTNFIRVEKTKNYSVISNGFLRQKDISWKAKGILAYILTLPDDWVINLKEVMRHATEGEAAFRSGWKELTDAGYVERRPVRNGQRIEYWETIIREVPIRAANSLDGDFQDVDNQDVDNLDVDNLDLDNQDVDNRKLLSTNNTKDLTKPITNKTNSKKTAPVKHKYGDLENVLLTDDEHKKLQDKFPNDHQKRINDLSYYIESKGAKYKSHYTTILNWARKDQQSQPKQLTNANDSPDDERPEDVEMPF